jgi:hypothetical protein
MPINLREMGSMLSLLVYIERVLLGALPRFALLERDER